jgi:hypothetical protein
LSERLDPPPPREVTCPLCGGRTNHIQVYEVPVVVFLLVYVMWRHATVAGCPRCVRATLWRQFWVSLPAANILFPVVGPLIFSKVSASDEAVVPSIPPEYHPWADVPSAPVAEWAGAGRGRGLRLAIALALVVAVSAAVFGILPSILR